MFVGQNKRGVQETENEKLTLIRSILFWNQISHNLAGSSIPTAILSVYI